MQPLQEQVGFLSQQPEGSEQGMFLSVFEDNCLTDLSSLKLLMSVLAHQNEHLPSEVTGMMQRGLTSYFYENKKKQLTIPVSSGLENLLI